MATGDDEGRGGDGSTAATDANAAYVFRVTVRLEPGARGVGDAGHLRDDGVPRGGSPGEPGWLYFRDNLWRGECGDESYMREVTEDALGTTVASVSFSELRTTQGYLDDLRETIADNLDLFNASTVDEVLSKYLGSSIHVTSEV
ncbi:LWR-salt protein [Halosimplex aquaticum]